MDVQDVLQDVASDTEGGVADVVNDYLESSFVAKQMKQYENDMWDNCDADYADMHKNTYEHVFEPDKKDVSLGGIKKYKDNLQRYRKSEDSAVAAYRNSFEKICANESSHNNEVSDACSKKAKAHFRSGLALAIIAAIIGLAAGIALIVFTSKFGDHASSKGMTNEYDLLYIAKAIGIALTVFSPVSFIANIFFFNKEKGKSKLERVRAKDPVTKETGNFKVYAQKYAGSLARGIIVFILIVGMIIGSLVFFLPAYKTVEVDSKDYGYKFTTSKNAEGEDVAYITGVYDEKMLPEVVTYYYEANIPTEVSRGGKTYKVVGIKELNLKSIQRLVIGDHIKSIDIGAFAGCESLKEIVFKDNLTDKLQIYYWFYDSYNDNFSIPSELSKIEYTPVGKNKSDLVVPNNMFRNLSNVTDIKVSDATEIGNGAFLNCTSLTNLDLGDCAESLQISEGSLYSCEYLAKLSLPTVNFGNSYDVNNNVITYLFNTPYMRYLSEITVTKDTYVLGYAFYYAKYLQTIRLEKAVTVRDYCFASCSSLTGLYVQPSLKKYIETNKTSLLQGSNNVKVYEI